MVDDNFLLYVNTHYSNILNISRQSGEYIEFKDKYEELISKNTLNKPECDSFLCKFFKKVLEDGINSFLSKVSEDTKLQCSVQKEIKNLEDIRKKLLLNDLDIAELYSLRNKVNEELSSIRNQRILIKLTKKEKWKERGLGFILGIIGAIILKYVFGIG